MLTKSEFREKILLHKQSVEFAIMRIVERLMHRGKTHDNSKLDEPEFSLFYEASPNLQKLKFGSPDYKEYIRELGIHHYQRNTHHPEYFENGIDGMSLLDIIEMLADWNSASALHGDINNDILKSIEINKVRFNISDQLYHILLNTVKEMGWTDTK